MKSPSLCVLVLASSLTLHACDKAPAPTPPTTPSVGPPASQTPTAQTSAPAPGAAPTTEVDPELLRRAHERVEQGVALLSKKQPQAARKAFYEAVTLAPKLATAQLGLARASLAVGNKEGARAAAQAALLHNKDVLVRAQALDLLRQTPPEAPEPWQSAAFYEKYLAYTLLTIPEDERPVALSVISPETLKSAKSALERRDEFVKEMGCKVVSIQGPFASPKALCDAMGEERECVWEAKPEVSSAPQTLQLGLNTEDTSDAYLVMGRKKTWYAALVASTTHASSGFVHESMKVQVDPVGPPRDGALTLRASARVRLGQEYQDQAEFYANEDITRVLCVWADKQPSCMSSLVKARRTIYTTKVGGSAEHAVLTEYGQDFTDGSPQWDTLPLGCKPLIVK